MRAAQAVGKIGGAVGRAVVDDDQLPFAAGERLRETFDQERE
jgi:allophanate hydrolase subunit 2